MKTLFLAVVTPLALSGCGGGTSSVVAPAGQSVPSEVAEKNTAVTPLAKMIGAWVMPCQSHTVDFSTIVPTPGVADAVDIVSGTEVYDKVDCSGPLIARWQDGAPITVRYVNTQIRQLRLDAAQLAAAVSVDVVTGSRPAGAPSMTGPTVTYEPIEQRMQWCFTYSDGNKNCFVDSGPVQAQSNLSGAFYISGADWYVLSQNGDEYLVTTHLQKRQ